MTQERAIRAFYEKRAAHDSRPLPKPHTVREKSARERDAVVNLNTLYHLIYCCHDKIYGECRRCVKTL